MKRHKMFLGLVVLLGVTGLSSSAIQRPDYDDTPNPEFFNPSWMAILPDDQPLSEVTMPGSHNTMALYGGIYAECQTWSLASQLRAGVRFLDVRVRHVNGNLTIYHGVSYQRAHFGQVLEGVADFLREYSTETVLMRVREEFSETNDIYGAVVDFIQRYAHWDLLWHSRLVPTVGEARGKLVFLQDFPGPDLGMRYGSLDIADAWKVPSLLHLEKKWQNVYNHLEAAPTGNKAQIFLTFSSGAGLFAFPRAVAQRINAQLYTYLKSKTDLNRRLGIICMDFPAAHMIKTIINFQLRKYFYLISNLASLNNTIETMRNKTLSDMDSPQEAEARPKSPLVISSIAVVNIIWWMALLAAIGFGAIHWNHCPVQPYIPIYMIVLGVVSLLSLSLTYIKSMWEDNSVLMVTSVCVGLLYLFDFCWFIAGTVWVYNVYPPNYSSESSNFCQKSLYLFAFVLTTLVWVSAGLMFFCGGCFFVCTCCTAVGAGRRLLPARISFYGSTSDYKTISGDV